MSVIKEDLTDPFNIRWIEVADLAHIPETANEVMFITISSTAQNLYDSVILPYKDIPNTAFSIITSGYYYGTTSNGYSQVNIDKANNTCSGAFRHNGSTEITTVKIRYR